MPKRRKKGGTRNSKGLTLKRNTISRDTTKCITSPNVSLEQSISSGYDVIWNDRSPVTTGQLPIIGQSLMKTLQGKEGLVQKKEGHQLLELFKSNMKTMHHHHTNDSEVQVKRSRRQQLEEISKVQNELKQLAKRLQYYDEDKMEGEEDKSVKLQQQQHHFHNNTDHNRLSGDTQVTSPTTLSVTTVTTTGNNTCTNTTAQCSDAGVVSCNNITTRGGVKAQCGDSGVVESDTDTMSCCDDDSSSDHYQPIGSHHCGGVADKNKIVVTTQDEGVAKTRPLQSINSNSNNFPSDDDPELDRIFASAEMTTNDCYNDTADDEQFWSTAAIELSHQEVGLMHSTPCRPPAPPTVTNSNTSSGADFIDMILTYNNDIDLILNQN